MVPTEPVNIRDVAAQAGVSTGTVSRVLNGERSVRRGTAEKVTRAAKALRYQLPARRPTGQRRAAARWKTGNIGLCFVSMTSEWAKHPVATAYLEGLSRACAEADLHPLTEFYGDANVLPAMVRQQKIDGLLFKGVPGSWLDEVKQQMPVVGLNAHAPSLKCDQVNCDDYDHGYAAAEHLWQRGHRRIAFIGNSPTHPMHIMRQQGHERFLRVHNAYHSELVQVSNNADAHPQGAYPMFTEELKHWQALPDGRRPTAVVAANDWIAAGVYRSAEPLGWSIPDQLSVVGFDNTHGLCEVLDPPLTSFETPIERAAFIAAQLLIDRLRGVRHDIEPVTQLVAGDIIQRQSVCAIDAPA